MKQSTCQLEVDLLPSEMWIQVFAKIKSAADLASVMRTCRPFRDLAQQLLYRRVTWHRRSSTQDNLSFWPSNPRMRNVPTSVFIAVSSGSFTSFNPDSDPCGADHLAGDRSDRPPGMVPLSQNVDFDEVFEAPRVSSNAWNKQFLDTRYYPWIQVDQEAELQSFTDFGNVYQSDDTQMIGYRAYDSLVQELSLFTHLETLTFSRTWLPVTFHDLIHRLPCLSCLHIFSCKVYDPVLFEGQNLPMGSASSNTNSRSADHSTLRLRELTIYGLRTRSNGVAAQREITRVLSLVTAQSLFRLRLGWFKGIDLPWSRVFRPIDNNVSKKVPSTLQDIEVIFPRERLNFVETPTTPEEHRAFIETARTLFRSYIFDAPNLKRLIVKTAYDLADIVVPPLSLQHLCQIWAPISFAEMLSNGRSFDILDVCLGPSPLSLTIEKLGTIANAQQGLRGLGVTVISYNTELLHAITSLYPNLNALRIMYNLDPPSEVNIYHFPA
jgi:hypothetical protein